MNQPFIPNPNDPVLKLNLSLIHKDFVHGDLSVIITWTLDDQRPCLVIIPSHKRIDNQEITPVVIPDTMAWAWSEDNRLRDNEHCIISSALYATVLYGPSATMKQAFKIATLIHDHLDDLILCPPMPIFFDKSVVGTAHIRDLSTGKLTQKEILDDV